MNKDFFGAGEEEFGRSAQEGGLTDKENSINFKGQRSKFCHFHLEWITGLVITYKKHKTLCPW